VGGNGGQGGYVAPAPAMPGPAPEQVPAPKPQEEVKPTTSTSTSLLIVSLPADATLTVDGQLTTSTSSTRYFASPVLEPGKDYYYTLKAEASRNGQVVSAMKRVTVRAGEETRVSMDLPASTTAAK
jgi:uncharacterized protein (TIGR03000 family)